MSVVGAVAGVSVTDGDQAARWRRGAAWVLVALAGAALLPVIVELVRAIWIMGNSTYCASGSCGLDGNIGGVAKNLDILEARGVLAAAGVTSLSIYVPMLVLEMLVIGLLVLTSLGLAPTRIAEGPRPDSLMLARLGVIVGFVLVLMLLAVNWEFVRWLSYVTD